MDTRSEPVDRRSFLQYAGTAAGTAMLAGCSGSQPDDAGTPDTDTPTSTEAGDETAADNGSFPVTVIQGEMASTLDPHNHRETTTRSVLLQMYERIISRDGEGRVVSRLATGWERVDDGDIRFDIRTGVEFHEGQSLTAEDCATRTRTAGSGTSNDRPTMRRSRKHSLTSTRSHANQRQKYSRIPPS